MAITITVFSGVDTPSTGFSTTTVSPAKEELGPGWATDDVYPPLAELRRALLTDEEWAVMSSWEKDVWEMYYMPDWERLACIEQILVDTPATQRAQRHEEILAALRSLGASTSVAVDHLDDSHVVSVDAVLPTVVVEGPEDIRSALTSVITTLPFTCSTVCLPRNPVAAAVLVASSTPAPLECVLNTNTTLVEAVPLASMGEFPAVFMPAAFALMIQRHQLYNGSKIFMPTSGHLIASKLPRPMPWPSFMGVHVDRAEARPLPWQSFVKGNDCEFPSDGVEKASRRYISDSPSATFCDVIQFSVTDLHATMRRLELKLLCSASVTLLTVLLDSGKFASHWLVSCVCGPAISSSNSVMCDEWVLSPWDYGQAVVAEFDKVFYSQASFGTYPRNLMLQGLEISGSNDQIVDERYPPNIVIPCFICKPLSMEITRLYVAECSVPSSGDLEEAIKRMDMSALCKYSSQAELNDSSTSISICLRLDSELGMTSVVQFLSSSYYTTVCDLLREMHDGWEYIIFNASTCHSHLNDGVIHTFWRCLAWQAFITWHKQRLPVQAIKYMDFCWFTAAGCSIPSSDKSHETWQYFSHSELNENVYELLGKMSRGWNYMHFAIGIVFSYLSGIVVCHSTWQNCYLDHILFIPHIPWPACQDLHRTISLADICSPSNGIVILLSCGGHTHPLRLLWQGVTHSNLPSLSICKLKLQNHQETMHMKKVGLPRFDAFVCHVGKGYLDWKFARLALDRVQAVLLHVHAYQLASTMFSFAWANLNCIYFDINSSSLVNTLKKHPLPWDPGGKRMTSLDGHMVVILVEEAGCLVWISSDLHTSVSLKDLTESGSFQVLKRVSETSYRIRLLEGSSVHPVFHVSLLCQALKMAATWEELEELQGRFPEAPAWGQAGSQEGGGVRVPIVPDQQAHDEAAKEALVDKQRPARPVKPNPMYYCPAGNRDYKRHEPSYEEIILLDHGETTLSFV